MTLIGVGTLMPGLPTLLTNLIHQVRRMGRGAEGREAALEHAPALLPQGNKSSARTSNPRRHKFLARHGEKLTRQVGGEKRAMGGEGCMARS